MDYYRSTATKSAYFGTSPGDHDGIPIIDDNTSPDTLFPRDAGFGHDPSQYVPDMMAAPLGMKTYKETDWDALYDEQEREQSSLEHIYLREWKGNCLDQDGHGYCVTEDTEVLTPNGWVAYPNYNWSDPLATVNPLTHRMEYQVPFQRHVYEYDGPIIGSTNRRLDFAVTPDHHMYVRKWDERRRTLSSRYSFVRAADIGWYAGFMHAPSGWLGTDVMELEVPGDRRYDGDDFVALLGLIASDGYAGGTDKTHNLVSFASFREDIRPAVMALAIRLGFKEAPSRPGVWNRWGAGALAEWLRQNCYTSPALKARSKRVPDFVKCLSQRQIKLFLHWFDDRNRDGRQFYSTSKRLIDDLQELHLRIGKRSHIGNVPAKVAKYDGCASGEIRSGEAYILTVGEKDQLCIDRKKHIETGHYKGLVYCAAVPNHTLLTRRNGSVLISSNCWSYSTGAAIMMRRLALHVPFVRLNPHSVAAIVKGGKDEGGWCGLSLAKAREIGYAEEGTGPGQWPLHSRQASRFNDPLVKESMARFLVTDDWYDLGKPAYGQALTRLQQATCLFNNCPSPSDFNWWGHSVCALRYVRIEAGNWGLLILNSWKGWGRRGLSVLQGSKSRANGAVSIVDSLAA